MKKGVLFFSLVIWLLSGCSDYEKLLKSDDFDLKYDRAKAYYNEGDYARALPLLDQMLTVRMGTADEEEIRYYIAYCYYGQSQYLISSTLFKNFFISFPRSYRLKNVFIRVPTACIRLHHPTTWIKARLTRPCQNSSILLTRIKRATG